MIKAIVLDFFGVLWLETDLNMELLEEVRALQGEYTFLILSNMGRGGFDDRVPADIQNLFSKILLSGETGHAKPSQEAFEQVKDYLLPLKPQEILFIDDMLFNTKAAEQAGIAVHHYSSQKSLADIIASSGM